MSSIKQTQKNPNIEYWIDKLEDEIKTLHDILSDVTTKLKSKELKTNEKISIALKIEIISKDINDLNKELKSLIESTITSSVNNMSF